jgi:hypothetical protein
MISVRLGASIQAWDRLIKLIRGCKGQSKKKKKKTKKNETGIEKVFVLYWVWTHGSARHNF